jgi:hypothetical protein
MTEREESSLHSSSVHWVEALNQASVDMDAAAANIQSTFRHASERARANRCAIVNGTKRCEWRLKPI